MVVSAKISLKIFIRKNVLLLILVFSLGTRLLALVNSLGVIEYNRLLLKHPSNDREPICSPFLLFQSQMIKSEDLLPLASLTRCGLACESLKSLLKGMQMSLELLYELLIVLLIE